VQSHKKYRIEISGIGQHTPNWI